MSKNENPRQEKRDELLENLNNILEKYHYCKPFDLDGYLKLIYDIYYFFDTSENKSVIDRNEIEIIAKLGEIGGWNDYPGGIKKYEFEACIDVSKNLIAEIKEGFCGKYTETDFDISRELYDCPSPVWADMRSLETFKTDLLHLYYDEACDEESDEFEDNQ